MKSAIAEAQRLLRFSGSAPRSASRLAEMSERGQPPALDSESGALLPLTLPLQSANGVRRHEGSSPVRAETLGLVAKGNRARSRRDMLQRAEDIGFCLVCGVNGCTGHTVYQAEASTPRLVIYLTPVASDKTVKQWALCDSCGCLLAIPDTRPAPRCPLCHHVN